MKRHSLLDQAPLVSWKRKEERGFVPSALRMVGGASSNTSVGWGTP